MTRQQASRVGPTVRQRGATTIILTLVLLSVMSLATLTAARVGLNEMYISGNDMRARESKELAEAGLEFGIAWAGKNSIPWAGANNLTCLASATVAGCPGLPTVTDSSSGEDYEISSLMFERADSTSTFIRVTSVATGRDDSTITATSQTVIQQSGLLSQAGMDAPPLVFDGCMGNITGNPEVTPAWIDLDNDTIKDPGELDTAFMTSASGSCVNVGHLNLNGGNVELNHSFGNLWDYFFDVSQATFKNLASTTLSSAGGTYWIEGASASTFNNTTYGSASDPVIIVIADGCNKLKGTINGVVFFLEQDACGNGSMNGWGNVIINGSVAVNGAINKLTANSSFTSFGSDGSGTKVISPPISAARLPGTWKDF